MTLAERFRRWRTTKGYGVHSPLAFRLLQHVVRPRRDVVYYGEETIASYSLPYKLIVRARILLRLIAELQPSYVWLSPGMPDLMKEAVRLAGCVVRIYDGALFPEDITKADMIVLNDFKITKSLLKKILIPGKTMIAFGVKPEISVWTESLLKGGILLEAAESLIAVCTRDEGAHVYHIRKI